MHANIATLFNVSAFLLRGYVLHYTFADSLPSRDFGSIKLKFKGSLVHSPCTKVYTSTYFNHLFSWDPRCVSCLDMQFVIETQSWSMEVSSLFPNHNFQSWSEAGAKNKTIIFVSVCCCVLHNSIVFTSYSIVYMYLFVFIYVRSLTSEGLYEVVKLRCDIVRFISHFNISMYKWW